MAVRMVNNLVDRKDEVSVGETVEKKDLIAVDRLERWMADSLASLKVYYLVAVTAGNAVAH